MTDKISRRRRSENMRRIRSKDMKPELLVRQLVHGMGYRYRLHQTDLPGKPDLVFRPKHKVILVHGCFWHQHSDPGCRDGRLPKSNTHYWGPKLRRNLERDTMNQSHLREMGWDTLVVWECEAKDQDKLKKKISEFLIT